MDKEFKSQLLYIPFTNILKYLASYAKDKGTIIHPIILKNPFPSCCLLATSSHCRLCSQDMRYLLHVANYRARTRYIHFHRIILPKNMIEMQERVLRMAEDLKSVGVTVFLDLTHHITLSYPKDPTPTPPTDTSTHTTESCTPNSTHSSTNLPSHSTVLLESTILGWLHKSDTVLLIGSPSYAKRASYPTTLTHQESKFLSKKPNVIPLLLVGDFPSAFPPGYTGILGK
jgi:hypothetical protein